MKNVLYDGFLLAVASLMAAAALFATPWIAVPIILIGGVTLALCLL